MKPILKFQTDTVWKVFPPKPIFVENSYNPFRFYSLFLYLFKLHSRTEQINFKMDSLRYVQTACFFLGGSGTSKLNKRKNEKWLECRARARMMSGLRAHWIASPTHITSMNSADSKRSGVSRLSVNISPNFQENKNRFR